MKRLLFKRTIATIVLAAPMTIASAEETRGGYNGTPPPWACEQRCGDSLREALNNVPFQPQDLVAQKPFIDPEKPRPQPAPPPPPEVQDGEEEPRNYFPPKYHEVEIITGEMCRADPVKYKDMKAFCDFMICRIDCKTAANATQQAEDLAVQAVTEAVNYLLGSAESQPPVVVPAPGGVPLEAQKQEVVPGKINGNRSLDLPSME